MPPTLPKVIRVEREPGQAPHVFVDGQVFPWHLSAGDPISYDMDVDGPPAVRLTIPAESVVIVDKALVGSGLADRLAEHVHDDAPAAGG